MQSSSPRPDLAAVTDDEEQIEPSNGLDPTALTALEPGPELPHAGEAADGVEEDAAPGVATSDDPPAESIVAGSDGPEAEPETAFTLADAPDAPVQAEDTVAKDTVAAPDQAAPEPPVDHRETDQTIAPVEPTSAADPGSPLPGAEWGYLDGDGNLRQRDGELHKGRIVGKITGANPAIAFGFYARQFDQFLGRVDALAAEIEAAPNKAAFLGRVRRLQEQAPEVEGLGDFDGLLRRLQAVETGISAELDRRRAAKERLAARAEALQDSTEWKATGDELRALFEEWKTVGGLGRDEEQALWERFNTARQAFFGRRQTYFAERERERAEHLAQKDDLCARAETLQASTDWRATSDALKALQVEWKAVGSAGREADQALWARFRGAMDVFFASRAAQFETNRRTKESLCAAAEALADSTDWAATSSTMKGLQEQWKQAGFAGGDQDDALWARFRRALDAFYDRRSEVFAERDRAYAENLRQKEAIVAEAEALALADEHHLRPATQRIKTLQEDWKAIGPVSRERADDLWRRFRQACDGVFSRSREHWERRQTENRTNLKDSLDRQRTFARELMDSIARDDELLTRWEDQLANLKPGGREPEIRRDLEGKIAGLQQRLEGKQTRIEELLAQIAELDARLTEGER